MDLRAGIRAGVGAGARMTPAATIVAHRAGNDLSTLRAAAAHADVLEADVHLFRGRLEIRHAKTIGPIPVLWERWHLVERTRPPLVLGDLLAAADPGVGLMLDLKGPDPRLAGAVTRMTLDRPLLVSSRVWWTLERLRGLPGITTLHSVGSPRQLRTLMRRYGPRELEGVSIHRRLLTPGIVTELRGRAPRVWSWPVNDAATATRLAAWGVNGMISDAPTAIRPPGAGAAPAPAPQ